MKLEELKARSEACGSRPRLVEIARQAQSPSAAYDWAKKEKFGEESAKACRYLAMIKRDFSEKTFEAAVIEYREKIRVACDFLELLPIIQVASRLHFFWYYLQEKGLKNIRLADYDECCADMVERCLDMISKLYPPNKQLVMEKIGAEMYLYEAKELVKSIRQGEPLDEYALNKTGRVLAAFITIVGELAGIHGQALACSNCSNHMLVS